MQGLEEEGHSADSKVWKGRKDLCLRLNKKLIKKGYSRNYKGNQLFLRKQMEAMVVVLKPNASKEEIEQLRKKLEVKKPKGVDTKKYCGVLQLKEDPMDIQKKMRDEDHERIFSTLDN